MEEDLVQVDIYEESSTSSGLYSEPVLAHETADQDNAIIEERQEKEYGEQPSTSCAHTVLLEKTIDAERSTDEESEELVQEERIGQLFSQQH